MIANVTVNQQPVAAAGPDRSILVNTAATLRRHRKLRSGRVPIVSYAWTQTAGTPVVLTNADTASPGFTGGTAFLTLTFQLTVTDNLGTTASDTVTIIVNRPPVANAGADQIVKTRAAVTLHGSGSENRMVR